MESSSPVEEINQLRNSPSFFFWERELRRVLNKERDELVERIGGIEEYIYVLIRDSTNSVLAEMYFNDALNKVLESWQPGQFRSDYYTAAILDLVAAFAPPNGCVRILGFMLRNQFFPRITEVKDTGVVRDLHKKALYLLEAYFPSAPLSAENNDLVFSNYVRLLESYRQHPEFANYSQERLNFLGVADNTDESSPPSSPLQVLAIETKQTNYEHILNELRQVSSRLEQMIQHLNLSVGNSWQSSSEQNLTFLAYDQVRDEPFSKMLADEIRKEAERSLLIQGRPLTTLDYDDDPFSDTIYVGK